MKHWLGSKAAEYRVAACTNPWNMLKKRQLINRWCRGNSMENKAEKVSSLRAKLAARRQAMDGEASALLSPEAASDFGGRNQSSKRVVFSGLDSFSEPDATSGAHLPRSLYRGTDSAVNSH